jgi:hypothetical protein
MDRTKTDKKRLHFIYRTINKLNGRWYVGLHSTNDEEDGYLGSGIRLQHEIAKYGSENFSREIIEFLPSRKALKARERDLVNEEMLADSLCLNLKLGGHGGWDHINKHPRSEATRKRMSESAKKKIQDPKRAAKAAITLAKNHETRSAEQKESTRLKKIAAFAAQTPEQKAAINARRSEAAKARWASHRLQADHHSPPKIEQSQ